MGSPPSSTLLPWAPLALAGLQRLDGLLVCNSRLSTNYATNFPDIPIYFGINLQSKDIWDPAEYCKTQSPDSIDMTEHQPYLHLLSVGPFVGKPF